MDFMIIRGVFRHIFCRGVIGENTLEGRFWRAPGYHGISVAQDLHRLELDPDVNEETWTLFLMGPKEKNWGFIDKDGTWIPHQIYLEERKNNSR